MIISVNDVVSTVALVIVYWLSPLARDPWINDVCRVMAVGSNVVVSTVSENESTRLPVLRSKLTNPSGTMIGLTLSLTNVVTANADDEVTATSAFPNVSFTSP